MSPVLFVLLSLDLTKSFKREIKDVDMLMFADDIAVYSNNVASVQRAINFIDSWARGVRLCINVSKTKAVKFRRGGHLSSSDVLFVGNDRVDFVNSFTYLGLTLNYTGKSFAEHIAERSKKAILCANAGIRNPRTLSIKTALKLFDLKVAPVASYALPVIWYYLTRENLLTLERVKASFLKRALGVSYTSKNRLVYALVNCETFVCLFV
jgi:hypothetical protein